MNEIIESELRDFRRVPLDQVDPRVNVKRIIPDAVNDYRVSVASFQSSI